MTDAAYNHPKRSNAAAGQRISTHPSYTEYSWDRLSRQQQNAQPQRQPQRPKQPQRAQNVRPGAAAEQRLAAQRGAAPRAAEQHSPVRGYPNVGAQSARVQQSSAAYAGQRRDRMYSQPRGAAHGSYSRPGAYGQPGAYGRQGANPRPGANAYDPRAKARAEAQQRAAANREKAAAAIRRQAAKAERLRRKSLVAIHTIATEKRYAFPLAIVLIALCFTILIMAIVTTSVQISEITAENSALQRQYNSLVSEENELRLRLETRDDLRTVENMAKTELGLVKKDQVERYYLTVRKEDRIELVEEAAAEKTNILDGILRFGASVVERVKAFFGVE